jgi:hypothetical protein
MQYPTLNRVLASMLVSRCKVQDPEARISSRTFEYGSLYDAIMAHASETGVTYGREIMAWNRNTVQERNKWAAVKLQYESATTARLRN